jgi:hypothetical protein
LEAAGTDLTLDLVFGEELSVTRAVLHYRISQGRIMQLGGWEANMMCNNKGSHVLMLGETRTVGINNYPSDPFVTVEAGIPRKRVFQLP